MNDVFSEFGGGGGGGGGGGTGTLEFDYNSSMNIEKIKDNSSCPAVASTL